MESAYYGNQQSKKKVNVGGILHMTTSMIKNHAKLCQQSHTAKYAGKSFQDVILLGQQYNWEETQEQFQFSLVDNFGEIRIVLFKKSHGDGQEFHFQAGTYVKVFGDINIQDGQFFIAAKNIQEANCVDARLTFLWDIKKDFKNLCDMNKVLL